MSEDEYDAYNDFAGLTEEDFARLEASYGDIGLPPPPQSTGSAAPFISIEIEDKNFAEIGSPVQKYRRRGTLTVTDLISLAWCEVQFDYGLRQKRSRRLADRLPSFKLESGKEIIVQQDVAARNDKTTKRGRFIHKELELALQPEEIRIVTTSEEEHWAFRIINFLSSLVALKAEGCVREVPVFGLVNDALVVGIIDELLLREPETGTKRTSDSPLPSPKRLCRSPSPTELFPAAPAPAPASPPQHSIRVIDTKTRRTDSLPSDEDTEPARLQVMLYHRLVTGLMETSAAFDFPALWARLALRPSAPFSGEFLQQTTAILGGDSLPICLDDLVLLLRTTVAGLGLPALDSTVEIIYRSQNKYADRRHESKGKAPAINPEDEDIAKAIEMSLADAFETDLANALKESAAIDVPPAPFIQLGDCNVVEAGIQGPSNKPTGDSTPILNTEQLDGRQYILNELAAPDGFQPPVQVPEDAAVSNIIGTKEFPMDDTLLDTYLTSALQWWNGARKARGVSERQTGRCYSCEYRNDCEWRAQKASEATLRYRLSKGAS
ncbi:exonuclease V [Mycena rosella]|uniref:Exonuclease V n=1 Tax=Mycena rosella TaxID=1033263 RepID=A0AAD7CVD4_MYCRO|nr:exonuclease V [Mycena rosella]